MEANITFEDYLTSKLIESNKFRQQDPTKFEKLEKEFEQMHPDSFTAQKLYLINPLRRRFLLKPVEQNVKETEKPKKTLRPKIKR